MKILVFTTAFPNNVWPNHGVFVKERVAGFGRLPGCEIRVVAPVPYYPPIRGGSRASYSRVRREETIEGIAVSHPRYLVVPKVGMSSHGLTMFLGSLGVVRKIRREFDFDLISAHTVYPDGLAGVLLGGYFGKPVVVSARGSDLNVFPEFPLIRRLIRFTLSRADRAIAVCQALQEVMTTLGTPDHKIAVVPNGVDPERFRGGDPGRARTELGLNPDGRLILSVGNLTPNKGFHLLIHALAILADRRETRDLRLAIVGEGAYRPELESLVDSLDLGDRVRLVGEVRHHELFLWYIAADLFCLVSRHEGWPNVTVESLACGTPVVATDVGGQREILRSDELGLFTERDAPSIARTIATALEREWNPVEIARIAQQRTWRRVAVEMKAVFDSAVDTPAPG